MTTDGSGNASISFPIAVAVAEGLFMTSTATLLDSTQQPVETSEFSAAIPVIAAAAAIDIEKLTNGADADTATGPLVAVGDPVTFTYEVTNTGNVGLENVVVVDDVLGPVTNIVNQGNGDNTLDIGETWIFEATSTAAAQPISQTAAAPAKTATTGDEAYIPLTPVRRMTADAMVRCVSQIPHAWSTVEGDLTNLAAFRN